MGSLVLYKRVASPPSCAVMMLGDILGLQFQYKEPDLLGLEHKSADFKKINPMGTIPVLLDGDFAISESHTIMKYLLSKYGERCAERLYPSDVRARALVDQAMFFDTGVMFIHLKHVALPTLLHGLKGPSPKQQQDIDDAYSVLEAYLDGRPYVAADHLTLADLSLGSTVFSIQVIQQLDAARYPLCAKWLARLREESCFKNVGIPGAEAFTKLIRHFWMKNNQTNDMVNNGDHDMAYGRQPAQLGRAHDGRDPRTRSGLQGNRLHRHGT